MNRAVSGFGREIRIRDNLYWNVGNFRLIAHMQVGQPNRPPTRPTGEDEAFTDRLAVDFLLLKRNCQGARKNPLAYRTRIYEDAVYRLAI